MRRGEIWWAKLPAPRGSEPGYVRPMLIVQCDLLNRTTLQSVICAAITSNLKLAGALGNVRLRRGEAGLPKPSVINLSSLSTLDRDDLTECVGALDAARIAEVDHGLCRVLGLNLDA